MISLYFQMHRAFVLLFDSPWSALTVSVMEYQTIAAPKVNPANWLDWYEYSEDDDEVSSSFSASKLELREWRCLWKVFLWTLKIDNGSVALLWRNAKRYVNPGLSYFKRCFSLRALISKFTFTFCVSSK